MLLQEYLETFFGKCESPLKGKKVILNIYDRVFNCFKIILRWSISFTSFIEIHINIIRIENRKNNYPFFNYLLFYIWFCCIFIYCFPWTIYSDYYKYSYGILRKYMHKRKLHEVPTGHYCHFVLNGTSHKSHKFQLLSNFSAICCLLGLRILLRYIFWINRKRKTFSTIKWNPQKCWTNRQQ